MNRIWKAILIIAILSVLFLLSRVDLSGGPVMAREQHEKVTSVKAVSRLDILEARVDSLEAMLERAHIVAWHSTRYEVSFEPVDSTQEQ